MINSDVRYLAVSGIAMTMAGALHAQVSPGSAPSSLRPSYQALEVALFEQASRRVAPGRYDWGNAATATGGGTFSLGREYPSSDPGLDCNTCLDPCRRFRLSFRSTRGFGEYLGRMCYSPSSASWTVRSLEEENWTPISPPPPPPPPPPREIVVVEPESRIDPNTVRLTEAQMYARLEVSLSALGYVPSDDGVNEAAFTAYADDHLLNVTLSDLSNRQAQNAFIDAAEERAKYIEAMRRSATGDQECAEARSWSSGTSYLLSACLTTRARAQ